MYRREQVCLVHQSRPRCNAKFRVTSPLIEMRGFLLHSEFGIRVSPDTSPAPQA